MNLLIEAAKRAELFERSWLAPAPSRVLADRIERVSSQTTSEVGATLRAAAARVLTGELRELEPELSLAMAQLGSTRDRAHHERYAAWVAFLGGQAALPPTPPPALARVEPHRGSFLLGSAGTRVFLPTGPSFADALNGTAADDQPWLIEGGDHSSALAETVTRAMELLRRYDRQLSDDIEDFIAYLILTPRRTACVSFNLGLRFTRAIFVSPWVREGDAHLLAASIAHEYYHQVSWALHASTMLSGVKAPLGTLRSPLSGNSSHVQSMLDAMVIFLCNLRFFTRALDVDEVDPRFRDAIRERRDHLRSKYPELRAVLIDEIEEGSPARRFVDALYAIYRET